MDINLRFVAVVTSLGGGITAHICMHFDLPQPLAEHSYQSYLEYLEKLTQEIKKEDCIGHVQKRLGTALRSYSNFFFLYAFFSQVRNIPERIILISTTGLR